MLEFAFCLSFISMIVWTYLFYKYPFRPSFIIVLYSFFSFGVRPLAVSLCEDFSPFYMFKQATYDLGVLVTNLCVFIYLLSYLFAARSGVVIKSYDKKKLRYFSKYLFALTVAFLILAVSIFGQTILPGTRSTGLSKAASGSQVFFAIVSTLVVPAIALRIFLFIEPQSSMQQRSKDLICIAVLIVLSMLFYQRGPAIQGIILGFFLSTAYLSKRRLYLFMRVLPLLLLGAVVILEGRSIVSQGVSWFYGAEKIISSQSTDGITRSCKIAMSGSQEHDQVWPTVFEFTAQVGHDYYMNLFAAVFRPFYTAEEREIMGLQTSVDSLNLFNDSETYLGKNFGFSITGWQYQYFSIGILVFPMAIVLGLLSALLENKLLVSHTLDISKFLRVLVIFHIVGMLNGAFDERLKWVVFSAILLLLVFWVSKIKLIQSRLGIYSGQTK